MKNLHKAFSVAILAMLSALVSCVRPAPHLALPTPTLGPTLRDLVQGRDLHIGAAFSPPQYRSQPDLMARFGREFNALAVENAMKWDAIHPGLRMYHFAAADEIVSFARSHNQAIYAHLLTWDLQNPAWLTRGKFSRSEMMDILHQHIQTVVGRYRGQVYAWDVVNEPFNNDGSLRDTIWLRTIGPEYIPLAFRWAHESDPQARLFLNEQGAEGMNPKSDAVYALVNELRRTGVPIDGVGLQMHVWLRGSPTPDELAQNMQRLGALGLEVYITEMDVRTHLNPNPDGIKLSLLADRYREIFTTCLQAANCKAFITWGFTDNSSWLPFLTGKPELPLLFDSQGQPKLAYYAVLDTLRNK